MANGLCDVYGVRPATVRAQAVIADRLGGRVEEIIHSAAHRAREIETSIEVPIRRRKNSNQSSDEHRNAVDIDRDAKRVADNDTRTVAEGSRPASTHREDFACRIGP